MSFTIHYFASASSYTSKNSESLPAPLPLSALFSELEGRYPGIIETVLGSCAVSLNGGYVEYQGGGEGKGGGEGGGGVIIQAGDEVAIIPPVSSG